MNPENLTKEIHDKYPEVWDELKSHEIERTDLSFYTKCVHNQIMCMTEVPHSIIGILPFTMLYALLEDFFEGNGIFITLIHDRKHKIWGYFCQDIKANKGYCIGSYKTKNEAKYQAILKACDILSEKLDEDMKSAATKKEVKN